MTQEKLILIELAETRKEIQGLKTLLLALTNKDVKTPKKVGKSVNEYRAERHLSHLKKQIK